MPPAGLFGELSSQGGSHVLCGPLVVVLPVRQFCPLWATALMHITVAALPLLRLCRFSISLQRCHLSDLLHWFQFTAGPLTRL